MLNLQLINQNYVNKLINIVVLFISFSTVAMAQTQQPLSTRQEKAQQRQEKINQLIKQEEEGSLIYNKQWLLGFNLNTDGWNLTYEHGKYKTITKTNIWWLQLGERKDPHQTKVSTVYDYSNMTYYNTDPFYYGKQNTFYYLKFGLGNQMLIGGKGNKNGVAVSWIYGGGVSLGMLKPYYLQILDSTNNYSDIRYTPANENIFIGNDSVNLIAGKGPFGKGFNEIKFTPGLHLRTALRFDYGRYNETLSALEVVINFEYYFSKMPIMVWNDGYHAFANAYVAIEFGGRRK
jgi:hypothetical protein